MDLFRNKGSTLKPINRLSLVERSMVRRLTTNNKVGSKWGALNSYLMSNYGE